MAAGHNNVAAVGTSASNAYFTKSFLSSYSQGVSHAQVVILKDNLRTYRKSTPSDLWTGIASLSGNTSPLFDADTGANLAVFQRNEDLITDGIYGAASRNAMHRTIGLSSKGWVRVLKSAPGYMNYNDTPNGLAADAAYKLDYSWVTSTTRDTLHALGYDFYLNTGKKIEVNDASLIDGVQSPEHSTHKSGKEMDIRNNRMTAAQEKKWLELCIAHSNVKRIIFHTKHGLTSGKVVIDAHHQDHFHIHTCN
ncbi:hypothetical protein PAECIP111893_00035 [Paenibacillus plantiphilus]|uniref:Penicillin-insensitive murein endopeptidase n=1 Tax=Paenibacillus plantiphilus TaxID=2905650 RepID=A0ABN8FTS1_9BACL|nr:peptidoglycan-binding protein [Paenibacillus plantiphilus]CAH1189937.1 hypothetical protein PAECIP111893_00035 [Paenibacillus plantiphilus]